MMCRYNSVSPTIEVYQIPETENQLYRSGDWIQEYKVIDWIGEGASCSVYLVEKGNLFAMKVLHPKYTYGGECELEILQKNQGPYCVRLIESFTHVNQMCIVMEYLHGTLMDLIDTEMIDCYGTNLFTQLLEIADDLDKRQICHLDLKPENIGYVMVHQRPILKLIDFGLSVSYSDTVSMGGTSEYTCHDLFSTGYKSVDYRYDIWSIACIFYEMKMKNYLFGGLSYSNTNEKNREMIQQVISTLDYSDPFICFIKDLLQGMTAKKALSHDWLN
jgi:serine/threonine protein kinase